MPRYAPILIWCGLIVIGLFFLVFGPDQRPQPTAARDMAKNTFLLPNDINLQGFSGRYVVAPDGIKRGAVLKPSDVGDEPALLDGAQGRLLLAVAVPSAGVAKGWNAGSKLQLCGKGPTTFGPVTLAAVRCETGKPSVTTCAGLVELPKTGASDVASKALKDQTTNELRLAEICD
jgi:hypothetical protein